MAEQVLICHSFLPEGQLARWNKDFPDLIFLDAREPSAFAKYHGQATLTFGLPEIGAIPAMPKLRWIQLASAGVPAALCPIAIERKIRVTNLAGLYGPTIAEHALAMMLILSRNLHVVLRNQAIKTWERSVADTMRDLAGKTLGIIGLGNIGQNIARLGQAMGMRVVGCRRTAMKTPFVDRVYEIGERNVLAAESDIIAVAAPLTRETDGLLGREFFQAIRAGAIVINVSRGPVIQEPALFEALQSGHVFGAGLDVFTTEPLPADNPLWAHPNVIVSPHYSGETVNLYSPPAERFTRNLHNWLAGRDLEGNVKLHLGY
jgi:phosphoglycerate dehydrogenase-like enzyme